MFIGYFFMDRKLEKQMGEKGEAPEILSRFPT